VSTSLKTSLSVVTFVLTPWWGLDEPWIYIRALVSGHTDSLIGVTVMIWLVGRTIRRVSKSTMSAIELGALCSASAIALGAR